MKNSNNGGARQNKPMSGQGNRAQNKDNLDSREGLEQQEKGEDVTHNKKEMKRDRKKVKNDNEKKDL
jgi:hypothetical protein